MLPPLKPPEPNMGRSSPTARSRDGPTRRSEDDEQSLARTSAKSPHSHAVPCANAAQKTQRWLVAAEMSRTPTRAGGFKTSRALGTRRAATPSIDAVPFDRRLPSRVEERARNAPKAAAPILAHLASQGGHTRARTQSGAIPTARLLKPARNTDAALIGHRAVGTQGQRSSAKAFGEVRPHARPGLSGPHAPAMCAARDLRRPPPPAKASRPTSSTQRPTPGRPAKPEAWHRKQGASNQASLRLKASPPLNAINIESMHRPPKRYVQAERALLL